MPDLSLSGKVALVTGGGRGVGKAIAKLLAAYGASVVVNDLGVSLGGAEPSPGPADEVVSEIADFNSAGRVVQSAIDEFGRIDILVNPAGILRDRMVFNMARRSGTPSSQSISRGTSTSFAT